MSLGLIKRFGRKIQMESYTDGAYVDGFWVPGEPVKKEILASVQPLSSADLLRMPENQRQTEMIKVYTLEPLSTGSVNDKRNADVLIVDGRRFEVSGIMNWTVQLPSGAIQYFRADCVLENREVGT